MQHREGLYLDWDTNTQGALTRARSSVAALRTIAAIQREERPATDAERKVLAGWSGWGPLTPVFDPKTDSWQKLSDEVMDLLTPEQVDAGKSATYSAFYTPPAIASACWSMLTSLGFDGGRVLEPGCGAGVFMAHRPTDLDNPVRMVGVERDPTTAAIAAALHPDAQVIASPLEEARVSECSVDAVVGNVPFGDVSVFDPAAPDAVRDSLHGYFVWRSIRALRPGGVAVLISSRYLLDRGRDYARKALAEEGQFLGAIRLPNAALESGGTSVVTDIVVFRKRRDGERREAGDWTEVEYPAELGEEPVNKWILANRAMVLGTLAPDRAPRYGRTVRVNPAEGAPKGPELAPYVAEQVRQAGEVLARTARRVNRVWDVDPEPEAVTHVPVVDAQGRKERSFHVVDGQVRQVRDRQLTPVKNASAELVALIGLRDAAVALLDAEADHSTPDMALAPLRAKVNELYDKYVAQFGYLNRSTLIEGKPDEETGEPTITRRRPDMGGFRKDPDYVTVLALEVWDDETGIGGKAPILHGRVNRAAQRPDHADTPAEALAICLDMHGRVDLPEIARLLRVGDPNDVPGMLGDLVYRDPTARAWVPTDEYLSGNVREKLDAARRAAERDPAYGRNVAALEKIHPKDLEPGEIRARLGAPWIPPEDVADFLEELLGARPKVTRVKVTAEWEISIDRWQADSAAATTEWGTDRKNAYKLAELACNGKQPIVYDRVSNGHGGETSVRNVPDTMEAEAKQKALMDRFADWVWEDPARSDRLAAEYNRLFNSHVLRRFDGSHLTFPGLAPTFTPYTHQRDMVHQATSIPRALCGHTVGGGKTATMFMTATTLRRLGLVNKPLIVVPKHILEQVAREGRQLFPGAKILMAGEEDVKDASDRKLFAARCATGDWDAVVITQPMFGALPVHPQTQARYLYAKVEEFREAIAERDSKDGRDRATKQLEKMVDNMRARAKELLHKRMDDGLFFEQLGVDYLLVDEAHYYKNLSVPVRTDGFSVKMSKRASDLDMKLRRLSERRDRCATLFTGTPVSNTMLELYVMLQYLAPDLLEELDIASPDAWAATFVKFESRVEVAPDGISFRIKRRPAKFINVPELWMLLAQVADIRNAVALGLLRPAAWYHTLVAPGSPQQREFIVDLARRADGGGRVELPDGRKDNMLLICSDGRKAALDPALVGIGGRARKIEAVAEQVAARYYAVRGEVPASLAHVELDQEHVERLRQIRATAGVDNLLQVVFCDLGTPNKDAGTQVYGKIRAGLIDAGVPAHAIRFIHDATTDQAKAGLFAECKAGKVAVLLGSTDKLGVGTNVQRLLMAMHHVDAPWRPADIEQREGRGLRPGNLIPIVEICRYVTRGSFDSYMWQALERKGGFIAQVLHGKGNAREVEDLGDGGLSAGEVKALATGNPVLLEKSAAEGEMTRLRQLSGAHTRSQKRLRSDIASWEKLVDKYDREGDAWGAIAKVVAGHDGAEAVDHRGDVLDEEALVGYLGGVAKEALEQGRSWRRAHLRGVRVEFSADDGWLARKDLRVVLSDDDGHRVVVKLDGKWARPTQHGKIVAELFAKLDGAEHEAQWSARSADDYRKRIADAVPLEGKPFPHADELRAAEDRLDGIEEQIAQAAQELLEKGDGDKADAEADVVVDAGDEPVEVHSDPMPEIPEHYRNPQPEPEPQPEREAVTAAEPGTVPEPVEVPAPVEVAKPEPVTAIEPKPARVRPESPAEPGVTYHAAWSPVDGTVTVVRDVRAGVSGPFGDYLAGSPEDAVKVLADNGYAVAGEWQVSAIGEHWCDLVRVPKRPVEFPMPEPYNSPTAPKRTKPTTAAPHKPLRRPRTAPAAGCTRMPIGRQIRHAAQVLGLTCQTLTDTTGAPVYRISGTTRDMTAAQAADYLLAGGFGAALFGGGAPVVHPDRLAEKGIEPVQVAGSWCELILS